MQKIAFNKAISVDVHNKTEKTKPKKSNEIKT